MNKSNGKKPLNPVWVHFERVLKEDGDGYNAHCPICNKRLKKTDVKFLTKHR